MRSLSALLRIKFCEVSSFSVRRPISAFYVSSIFTRFPSATVRQSRAAEYVTVSAAETTEEEGERRGAASVTRACEMRAMPGHMGKCHGESVMQGVSVTSLHGLLIVLIITKRKDKVHYAPSGHFEMFCLCFLRSSCCLAAPLLYYSRPACGTDLKTFNKTSELTFCGLCTSVVDWTCAAIYVGLSDANCTIFLRPGWIVVDCVDDGHYSILTAVIATPDNGIPCWLALCLGFPNRAQQRHKFARV